MTPFALSRGCHEDGDIARREPNNGVLEHSELIVSEALLEKRPCERRNFRQIPRTKAICCGIFGATSQRMAKRLARNEVGVDGLERRNLYAGGLPSRTG